MRAAFIVRGPGHRLQRRGERIRIGRQSIEFFLAQHHCVPISIGIGADSFIVDRNYLFYRTHDQLQIEGSRLATFYFDVFFFEGIEAAGGND